MAVNADAGMTSTKYIIVGDDDLDLGALTVDDRSGAGGGWAIRFTGTGKWTFHDALDCVDPTPSPTIPRTPVPTASDYVTIAVSLAMSATSEPTSSDEFFLKTTIASSLDLDESYLMDFTVTSQSTTRRWIRRSLLESYTWIVTFTVGASLSETAYESPSSFSAGIVSALTSDSFVSAVSTGIGATVDVSSVTAEVATAHGTAASNSSTSSDARSAAVVLYSLLGVLIVVAAAFMYYRSRPIPKSGIMSGIDTGVELSVKVETSNSAQPPKSSIAARYRSRQQFKSNAESAKDMSLDKLSVTVETPKPAQPAELNEIEYTEGSILDFLTSEVKISSYRAEILVERFADYGYDLTSDFQGMTDDELSKENLQGSIGLHPPEMRKFLAAVKRPFVVRPTPVVTSYDAVSEELLAENTYVLSENVTMLKGVSDVSITPQQNHSLSEHPSNNPSMQARGLVL